MKYGYKGRRLMYSLRLHLECLVILGVTLKDPKARSALAKVGKDEKQEIMSETHVLFNYNLI
jgi:hypothetical protein